MKLKPINEICYIRKFVSADGVQINLIDLQDIQAFSGKTPTTLEVHKLLRFLRY